MKNWWHRVARGIKVFVENPMTNLLKGIGLLFFGFSDASHTLEEHATRAQFRMGHGLILIGLFNVLAALPPILEGLESWTRFFEEREKKSRSSKTGGDS